MPLVCQFANVKVGLSCCPALACSARQTLNRSGFRSVQVPRCTLRPKPHKSVERDRGGRAGTPGARESSYESAVGDSRHRRRSKAFHMVQAVALGVSVMAAGLSLGLEDQHCGPGQHTGPSANWYGSGNFFAADESGGYWMTTPDGRCLGTGRRGELWLARRHAAQQADRRYGWNTRRAAATGSSPPTAASSASGMRTSTDRRVRST